MRAMALAALVLVACSRREVGESQPPRPEPTGGTTARPPAFTERSEERRRLVDRIAADGVVDSARVLDALRTVPRHAFVPAAWADEAYRDRPLPIGHGQTISQPTVVAAMTQAAAPQRGDKCLEIGTGSGYQAALLAELCGTVFSIEYLAPLAQQAERALRSAGYDTSRIQLRVGDGYRGWPEAAPFQVVIVTAAPERVPQPLLDQLDRGGRLVIPVGAQDGAQELLLYRRRTPGTDDGAFEKVQLMLVRFVPFVGEARGE